MYNRVCYYERCVRKGKILFPWFFKCEKKVELSGRRESGAGGEEGEGEEEKKLDSYL